jgi:hypothetical protein
MMAVFTEARTDYLIQVVQRTSWTDRLQHYNLVSRLPFRNSCHPLVTSFQILRSYTVSIDLFYLSFTRARQHTSDNLNLAYKNPTSLLQRTELNLRTQSSYSYDV